MNIPLHIAEAGGDKLEDYIKTEIELEKKQIRLGEVESQIQSIMIKVYKNIENYMPMPKTEPDRSHLLFKKYYEDDNMERRSVAIIPNMKRKQNVVIKEVMIAEELLRESKMLILEMKSLSHEVAGLIHIQNSRRDGKV